MPKKGFRKGGSKSFDGAPGSRGFHSSNDLPRGVDGLPVYGDGEGFGGPGHENPDDESTLSSTEVLSHYMSSLGFSAKEAKNSDTLEWAKNYSDPSGRVGRAVVVIKKDAVGLEPIGVDYATVTTQIHLSSDEDEVAARAPVFCKQDILRVLSHFAIVDDRSEVLVSECTLCGVMTAEFVDLGSGKTCNDCARRKGL